MDGGASCAAVFLLSYGVSRFLSMATDGAPHSGLVSAAVLEIAIGMLCSLDLIRHRRTRIAHKNGAAKGRPKTWSTEAT